MGLAEEPSKPGFDPLGAFLRWQNKLISRPAFQSWASRFPLTRRKTRKSGEQLFDLVAGFVYSQTLFACVDLEIIQKLAQKPQNATSLALKCGLSPQRMSTLCNAAVSIGLLRLGKDGRYDLAQLGAALIGVPGLIEMIRHHDILYRDMSDPLGVLSGEKETELAAFWPYVLGQTGDRPGADTMARYSDLMAASQGLVAEETLRQVTFSGVKTLMDVGGGTGAFLRAVSATHPNLDCVVFDLPDVVKHVTDLRAIGGSFLDPIPTGADAISLIRVLYDHNDETITTLLSHVFQALPPGGRVIVSEPMSGGTTPLRSTDAYFAFYTMAMRTGQVRAQAQIAEHLEKAGFVDIKTPKSARPYVTSVVTATKAGPNV